MLTVERSFDYDKVIRWIVNDPKVYPHISDDNSPRREDWRAVQSEDIWYIVVRLKGVKAGVFTFIPQNSICYEVHTCLLPIIYGERAIEAGRMARMWMFDFSPCRRIITNVPEYNRLALHYAMHCGMKEFGVNPKSYLKHGVLHDQIMLGISKENGSCH